MLSPILRVDAITAVTTAICFTTACTILGKTTSTAVHGSAWGLADHTAFDVVFIEFIFICFHGCHDVSIFIHVFVRY